ncbi:signal peptide-containing protein [Theileria equi strain WA]|uniref:Signal peptide-containing protein n=1 Tax=Theileria equi strain WA TaxID=1537102 RepID=L0AWF2_THEEQ|nr:signal peptide-containing protein [Theileria equi strain WA]AFZ79578.1 signal peptide-containing protein [Theileria equi strain WA]|eukprot:XP_004829244.1 signal peptide-containing protein [Theileria equi strain WA]
MKGLAVLCFIFICKICSAGFPWCFKVGNNKDNTFDHSVIDITIKEPPNVYVGGSTSERFFCPKVDNSIKAVVEGSLLIWQVGEGESCTLVKVRFKGDEPVYIKMSVVKDGAPQIEIFGKVNGEWISADRFNSRISGSTKMNIEDIEKGACKISNNNPSRLNLTYPNKEMVEINESEINGVKRIVYTPSDEVAVNEIYDEGLTLWRAPGNEKCTFVELFIKNSHKILYLEIYSEETFEPMYFEHHGGTWLYTTKDAFNSGFVNILNLKNENTSKRSLVVNKLAENLRGIPEQNDTREHMPNDSPLPGALKEGGIPFDHLDPWNMCTLESTARSSLRARGRHVNAEYVPVPPLQITPSGLKVESSPTSQSISTNLKENDSGISTNGNDNLEYIPLLPNDCEYSTQIVENMCTGNFDYLPAASPNKFFMDIQNDKEDVRLDFDNPNREKIIIGERDSCGVKQKTYSPRDEVNLTSVFCGSQKLWIADPGEKCTFLEYSSKEGSILVYLEVYNNDLFHPKFFTKTENLWSEMDLVEFSSKLKSMRNAKTSSDKL